MATTGKFTGNALILYTSIDDGSTWLPIAHSTEHSMEGTTDTLDANTKDSSGWREKIASLKGWSMSGAALVAYDATNGFKQLFAIWIAGAPIKVKFSTEETGDVYYTGDAILNSISKNAPQDDLVTMSWGLEGSGALTEDTVPV